MYCVVGFNLQVQRCKVQGKLDMTGGGYSGFGPWDSGSSSSYEMLSHVCSPEHLLLQLKPAP